MQGLGRSAQTAGFLALALGVAGSACQDASPVQPDEPAVFSMGAVPPFVFPDGCCYYQGRIVRTVVPPSAMPKPGRENFYAFPAGAAAGQKGVVATAPGAIGYSGGHWKFHGVVWNVTPYLLTSEAAVLAAAAAGHVTITRVPANDFLCPIQL